MTQLWTDSDGAWIRLDDGELCGPYRDDRELFLAIVGEDLIGPSGYAFGCPWGSDPASWVPAAVGLSRVLAGADGRLMPTQEEADAAVVTIVTAGSVEAWELHAQHPEMIPEPEADQ